MAKAEPVKKRKPTIEVLERRAAGQNVFGQGSPTIDLKEPGFECRWFNSEVSSDHVWRAKNQKGWENVRPEELADEEQIGGYTVSPDGFVTRGEKGREVLLKMPSNYRKQIQQRKAEANTRNMRPGVMKREVAQAAAEKFGSQAGDFVDAQVSIIGDVKDSKERIHRSLETE